MFGIDVGQYFQNILSGTRILQINTYEIQIQAEFIHVFLLTHICRYLYFYTFNLKNRHFCPPKCPRDIKGTKNTSLECLEHKRGTKLFFYSFVNYNVNLCNPLIRNVIQDTVSKILKNASNLLKR